MTTDFVLATIAIPGDATGIYLAYSTSTVMKPTYRGHKTMVNDQHTKVGVATKSFLSRENEYMSTFQHEVAFVPLIALPVEQLSAFEGQLLLELRQRYPLSGSAREWFRTTERQLIAELVWQLADA